MELKKVDDTAWSEANFHLSNIAQKNSASGNAHINSALGNHHKITEEFFGKLPFILNQRAIILHNKELVSILVPFSCAGTFHTGERPLTLGHLLVLWFACDWMQPCPECGTSAYVFRWGGSACSGKNRWTAWCPVCGKEVQGQTQGGQWIQPALHALWSHGKYPLEDYLKQC